MGPHYAAKNGRISAAKWLLDRGGDAYIRDGNWCSALNVAEFVRHVKVAGCWGKHYEKKRELL